MGRLTNSFIQASLVAFAIGAPSPRSVSSEPQSTVNEAQTVQVQPESVSKNLVVPLYDSELQNELREKQKREEKIFTDANPALMKIVENRFRNYARDEIVFFNFQTGEILDVMNRLPGVPLYREIPSEKRACEVGGIPSSRATRAQADSRRADLEKEINGFVYIATGAASDRDCYVQKVAPAFSAVKEIFRSQAVADVIGLHLSESAGNVWARSSANASGPFQFMPYHVRNFDQLAKRNGMQFHPSDIFASAWLAAAKLAVEQKRRGSRILAESSFQTGANLLFAINDGDEQLSKLGIEGVDDLDKYSHGGLTTFQVWQNPLARRQLGLQFGVQSYSYPAHNIVNNAIADELASSTPQWNVYSYRLKSAATLPTIARALDIPLEVLDSLNTHARAGKNQGFRTMPVNSNVYLPLEVDNRILERRDYWSNASEEHALCWRDFNSSSLRDREENTRLSRCFEKAGNIAMAYVLSLGYNDMDSRMSSAVQRYASHPFRQSVLEERIASAQAQNAQNTSGIIQQ